MTQETNPHLPPQRDVITASHSRPLELASKGRRFGTFLIDCICAYPFGTLFAVTVGLVFGRAGAALFERIPTFVLLGLILLLYYFIFEGIWARTPGKLVFGTIVVNESGGRPSLGQVVIRTLCRFIPLEAFSFFGKRGWHDSISKTYVIRRRKP